MPPARIGGRWHRGCRSGRSPEPDRQSAMPRRPWRSPPYQWRRRIAALGHQLSRCSNRALYCHVDAPSHGLPRWGRQCFPRRPCFVQRPCQEARRPRQGRPPRISTAAYGTGQPWPLYDTPRGYMSRRNRVGAALALGAQTGNDRTGQNLCWQPQHSESDDPPVHTLLPRRILVLVVAGPSPPGLTMKIGWQAHCPVVGLPATALAL